MRLVVRSFSVLCLLGASVFIPGLASATGPEVPCSQHSDPRLAQMTDDGTGLTSSLGLTSGRYALPATLNPTKLVVMFHGHGNDSCSWRNHLQQAAERGAVAVAMDYTGQKPDPWENYGWFVKEGAADSIAAAQHFLSVYPSITKVYAIGISMGGNSSGLAMAAGAVRASGAPLFDYWVDVEGVNNLTEEYLVARGVAPVNYGGKQAQIEIEEENGGSLEQQPANYAEITNVARAGDMMGLKGAIVVNGLDDGLVPTDQSPQMAAALNAVGVPAHLVTVVLRGSGESGTTGSAIAAGPVFGALGQTYTSPFAGHGWEGSDTQMVIKTGFDQLWELMASDGGVTPGETVVSGN
ncbi:MAG: alpha/beta hydrolase family protein [Actinomycetota bacterium]|nr:prolyl oligopeptidase family serine peptidase [Actinomycetota bacterium]